MSEGESDLAVQSLAAIGDTSVAKAMNIRKAAAVAFHEVDCQQAVRAAATHGPRPHYSHETGQAVYFWRRATDTARKPATYFWHGPAKIVAPQLPSTAWLSYNRHLVKAAPEKEFFSLSGWLEGISHAKKQFETEQIKGVIDLSKEQDDLPPPAEDQDYTGDKMVIFGCESISKNAVNFSNLMTMIQTFPSSLHNSNLGGNPRWS